MIWMILLLQAVLTFDPYSVKTIEYYPHDAKQMENATIAYKQVLLTFECMVVLKPGETVEDKIIAQEAPKMHPDAEQGRFHYRPKDCKPMHDLKQHYVCVDKNWGKKPPTIWWEPAKKLADPMPERKEPNA